MRVSYIILFLIFLFGVEQSLGFTSGINSVVSSLADYQSKSGGFRPTKESEANLEATAHALFLSSLFGLRDKINSAAVLEFIESVKNQDHGFSNIPGQPSDLESVRNALLCLNHLGNPGSVNPAELSAFIESLYDTNLYSNTVGGPGNLKSTAIAFQTLSSLNLLQVANNKLPAIKKYLEGLIKTEKNVTFFSTLTADNYYAIVVAQYVGIQFEKPETWAAYFRQRQARDGSSVGGFYTDQTHNEILFDDAYYAVAALHVLQEATKSPRSLPDSINTENLLRYASVLPRSLKAAALIYNAIARTSALQSIFKIASQYDVRDTKYRLVGNRIIQGSQIKPTLSVRTTYGLAHAGLDVSLTTTLKSTSSSTTGKLTWNADNQLYITEDVYDTANKLGDVTFDYVIRWLVADLGKDLTIELHETKTIGYDLTVKATANHADKDIEPKGIVAIGTEFSFAVSLGTVKNAKPSLLSGDFSVLFSVRDSSNVVIYQQAFDANGNTKPISFEYTLNSADIPGGEIKFNFDIGSAHGIHTTDFVSYNLPLTMVATDITFKNFKNRAPVYKIGESVDVTITPGSLPDLRTVKTYSSKDVYKLPARRKFFMDVYSADNNILLYSLPGTSNSTGDLSYNFQLPVKATFYSIGNNIVSFHYETASGASIPLQLFDSAEGELFEDGTQLSYSVNNELHLRNLKNAPQDGHLSYGNDVMFSFEVFDSVSGQSIFNADDSKQATVYLVLKHQEKGLSFTSTKEPAVQIAESGKPSHFSVSWAVNPNAVKGKGTLSLVAQSADGKEIPVYIENSQSVWQVNIEIGGELSYAEHHFSSEIDDEDTIFFVDFELSCNKKKLSGAELIATVSSASGNQKQRIYTLSVTHGGQDSGKYQLSWTQPTSQVKSGQYVIQLYRKVDSLRLGEKLEDIDQLDPLFVVSFNHKKTSVGFFIQSEVIALLLLGAGFFYMVYQKMELEGLREAKKLKKKAN